MHFENDIYLITGCGSGLGKYLYENIPRAIGLCRDNREAIIQENLTTKNLVIVHCAFNATAEISNYHRYYDDNLKLTEELCALPHKKFVYISSVDVYNERDFTYKTFKLIAESIIKKSATNALIFRCSALLGPTMRKNNFLKIVEDSVPSLTLTSDSTFNFVLQRDVEKVIGASVVNNLCGVYNFVSNDLLALETVAAKLNKIPSYGSYHYITPLVPNDKIVDHFSFLNKTSSQVVDEFLEDYCG